MPGLTSVIKKRKVIQPIFHKETPLLRNLKMRYASNASNNARIAKMKAKDPVGMKMYDNKLKTSNKTTADIINKNYQRSLYR